MTKHAEHTVKIENTIMYLALIRSLIFCFIIVTSIVLPIQFELPFIIFVGFLYFMYDFTLSKRINKQSKQVEQLVVLNSNIDEESQELKKRNDKLQSQNNVLSNKVELISQFESIKEEKLRVQTNLANITSYNNHLTNIIRGVNHEVSPWLGSVGNIASLAKEELNEKINKNINERDIEINKYLDEIKKAARQASDVLVLTSKNVKKLRNWSTTKSKLVDTVQSWCYIALMEHDIKGRLNNHNLNIDINSLDFDALHSPMLVSQIILNLVKNSIDHNEHMADELIVKIYGDGVNTLFVEDNGKGIPSNIIKNIFVPGVTTKQDSNLPCGLGLASTVDYCMLMGAIIRVESKVGKYTRFHIVFKMSATDTYKTKIEGSMGSRSAYYQVINQTDVPHSYTKQPSCTQIEIVPTTNPDTEFIARLYEIDSTLKNLK